MKRCDNCFETNSDGATNCVICGDPLDVPQIARPGGDLDEVTSPRFDRVAMSEVVEVDAPAEAVADVVVEDDYADEEITRKDLQVTDEPLSIDRIPLDELPPIPPSGGVAEVPPDPDRSSASRPADPADPDAEGSTQRVAASPTRAPATTPPPPPITGGRVVLQVFHDTEPRVVHSHPVVNDITLVGREDPQRDVFPDLDLGKLPRAEVSSDRASRQHLRLLREGDRHYLYVYKGSTGTQVNDRLVDPASYGKRFEIQVGDRIILGGKLRMKLARVE